MDPVSDPDVDPYTAIFVIDLQEANKKLTFSAYYFEGTFTSFSKKKSPKEVTKQ